MAGNIGAFTVLVAITLVAFIGSFNTVQGLPTINIGNASDFNLLQDGLISNYYEIVKVFHTAHPDPVSVAANFSNENRYELIFTGPNIDDRMILYPRHRAVLYYTELNTTHAMPSFYKHYQYKLARNARLENRSLDQLLTFAQAERIIILDGGDVAPRLLRRMPQWEQLKSLRHLALGVGKATWSELLIRPFLTRLPSLQQFSLNLANLSVDEVNAFLANQTIPTAWEMHGSIMDTYRLELHKKQ